MATSPYPSCVSLPCAEKPYPAILDFLVLRFPSISRSVWTARLHNGKVQDEAGRPITEATPYRPQQRLFYFRELPEELRIPLAETILFQNDELLVACKPPFLPVTPSGPYINECLLNRLRLKTGNHDLTPLHRIDRETSGLVLFSMNRQTRGLYASLFSDGRIEKTYEALAELEQRPAANTWTVENRLEKAEPWFRRQVVPGVVNARSRICLVDYRDNMAHFTLSPITGKTHQLRVHMSGLGFRIMNDRYYPELLPKQADDLDNPLQLIARRVRFTDPISAEVMEFESERSLGG
ncbi:pseudouridine synthase [Geopsychrobacter electrodiphilus]|uniref:pseudouridine synthase n=1 Tax=Geopsychrobacter electrodiphilus TaxID=225196 RepID=UPI00036D00A9|nr:pseudouridine synthase [Geopsychrobacter electrodiphilus]